MKTVLGWVLAMLVVIGIGIGAAAAAGTGGAVVSCGDVAACVGLANAATPNTPMLTPYAGTLPFNSGQFVRSAGMMRKWEVLLSFGGTAENPTLTVQVEPWPPQYPFCLAGSGTSGAGSAVFHPLIVRGSPACTEVGGGVVAVLGVHNSILYDIATTKGPLVRALRLLTTILAAIDNQ